MREILFRGKRLDNGEWVEGFYFIDERDIEDGVIWRDVPQIQQRYGDHYDYFDVDPLTIGQFTGLTDKNGKKIFEGDICTRSPYGMPSYKTTFSVHYHNLHCAFIIADDDGRVKTWLHEITNTHDVEVIGNIHDNPELLN